MTHTLWGKRPFPATPSGPFAAWKWELASPRDLTISRGELRTEVLRPPMGNRVSRGGVDRLLLAFEELASNGLRHGRSPVRVMVVSSAQRWLVDVTDAAVHSPPTLAVDRDPADGGLGLYLVARLCPLHGWSVRGGRKHVWACVETSGS